MTQGRLMFERVNGDWQQCPPGELGRLADRLRARLWFRALLGAGAALLLAAAIGFSAWQASSAVFGPPAGPGGGCAPCTPCQSTAP